MEIPKEIEKKIEDLKIQLKESKKFYQYELIPYKETEEDFGFFKISHAKKILKLLHEGKKLQYRHGLYKDVDVFMNPQKNRILVSGNEYVREDINEDNIMTFIIWVNGDWYLKNTN